LFLDEKVIFKRQAVFIVGGFMNSLSHIRFEWNAAITISIMKGMFHHSVFTASFTAVVCQQTTSFL